MDESDISEDSYGSAPGSPGLDYTPTSKASKSYTCLWNDCNLQLDNMTTLAHHVNQVHLDKKNTSKLVCEWSDCSRRGIPQTSRFALIGHVRSHTGERPFGCPVPECGRFFSRADALNKHIRTIHVKPSENEKDNNMHTLPLNGGKLPFVGGDVVEFPSIEAQSQQLYLDINNRHKAVVGLDNDDYYHKIPITSKYVFSEDLDLLKNRVIAFGGTADKYLRDVSDPATTANGADDAEDETDDEDLEDLDYNGLRRRFVWITELKESLDSELKGLQKSFRAEIIDKERLLDQVLDKVLDKKQDKKLPAVNKVPEGLSIPVVPTAVTDTAVPAVGESA